MENKLEFDYDVILCKKCGMKYPKEIEENHKNFCDNFYKKCKDCPYCLKEIPIKLYDSHILNHYNINENKNNNNLLDSNNNNNNNNIYFNNENYNNIENNNINNNNNIIINNNFINYNNNNFQNNNINNNQNNFNSINISNNNNNNNNNNNLSQQFFDVSDEAKSLENEKIEKELYEKKILGIVKDVKKKKKFKDKLKELDIDIEDGILATIDIIGCVFLVGPSITRTGLRIINLVNKLTNNNDENEAENNENGLTQGENNNIEKIIETLPTSILKKKIENSSIQCIICMEDFKEGDKVSTLPCFHVFHTNCIDKWLLKTHTCPICKFKVTMNSLIMNYEKIYKNK